MRILFASTNPFIPQFYGGIEACIDSLSRGLAAKEHEVAVLTVLMSGGFTWMRNRVLSRLFGFYRSSEKLGGYRVFRDWHADIPHAVTQLIDLFSPDIYVGHGGHSPDHLFPLHAVSIPAVAHLHGVAPLGKASELYEKGIRNFACCSFFVQSELRKRLENYGQIRSAVLYNPFDPEEYKVNMLGEHVTFINPHPLKGVELVLSVAKELPEIPFLFIKAWRTDPVIEARIRLLNNVTLLEPTKQMRSIYRRTKILIVASRVEEGAPRVITEAQISGIPVIASAIGGIPEILGEGGILLPPDDLAAWVRTLREVWHNAELWSMLSRRAVAQAEDERFSYHKAIELYESFLLDCISS